jgi:flagellin-like protein
MYAMKDPFAEALTGLLNRSGKNHYDMYKYHGKSVCFVDLHPHRGHEVKRCMMNFKQNEEAVSPVIGVILMVAITVILAAVIAAFVFGMTGNVQTTKIVGMQAKLDAGNITITVSGGPDMSTLQDITITHNGTSEAGDPPDATEFTTPSTSSSAIKWDAGKITGTFSVGDVITFTPKGGYTAGRLLIVGHWSDGAEQILLDRTF